MKKAIHIIAFAAVTIAALTSCAKEEFKENVIPAGEPIEVSLSGQIGEFTPADATKATAESVVRVTWGSGDKVYVYDGGNASIGTLTVTPDNNNASYAMLSGTITASAASPAPSKLTLVYVKGATAAPAITGGKISVDLSSQNAAEVPFVLYTTVAYDAAALTKTNEYISFDFATSVMTVNCTGLQTGASGAVAAIDKAEIDGVSTACELTIDGSGVTAVAGTTPGTITRTGTSVFQQSDSRGSFRLALAADPAAPAARNILVFQGSKVSGAAFTPTTLAAGKSYNTVYQMGEYIAPPAGMLPGGFTVADPDGIANSGDETKVHFSKGNLVATIDATGAPTAWKFVTNQYDYIGGNVANTSIGSTAGDVDLFGWSTDANSNNWGIHTKTGATPDYTTGSFKDWGKAYCASKSISLDTWRTLSTAEWQYLINKNGNENIRKGKYKYGVTVCEKANCLILAPDDFTGTIEASYDAATWASAEAAGLVCLPAAGYRHGSNVDLVGSGFYWSSSSANDSRAYFVYFTNSSVTPAGSGARNDSYSVRLITESSGGYAPAVKVTGVTLKSKTTIEVGDSETLVANVLPANAANKQINWLSNDTSVAAVDQNGKVTGVAEGSAVITATTEDGNFTAICIVTVVRLSLPGEFTINSDGDKIHFSKGNLYCSRTSSSSNDWTWHFYDEQYQYNNSYTQTDQWGSPIAAASDIQIDLFTWGYDSEKSINPVGTAYVTGYATDGATFSRSEDWGYVFGGNSSHWRTLTKDEWEYIISTRTGAGDKLGFATIGTVKGLVILPDSFTLPAGCTFISKSVDPYYENTYTQGDSGTWKAMENAGAVFLPAVGRRLSGSELNNRGDICRYWSSSAKDGTNSYNLLANYKNEIQTGDSERSSGFSVRLVKQ